MRVVTLARKYSPFSNHSQSHAWIRWLSFVVADIFLQQPTLCFHPVRNTTRPVLVIQNDIITRSTPTTAEYWCRSGGEQH